ncbi:unnamed protein product, partial [Adineta ricciae]
KTGNNHKNPSIATIQYNSQRAHRNDNLKSVILPAFNEAFTNSWLNKKERGHIFYNEHRKQTRKKNRFAFCRPPLFLCLFCCVLAALITGTLIVALVLIFTSSTTTLKTTLSTTQATTNITTTITTSTTTITTTNTTQMTTLNVSTTSTGTICSTTAIITMITLTSLPPQCSNYTLNTDGTRNAAYTTLGNTCDDHIFTSSPMWVRFSGAAGTLLANCPVPASNCNTNSPGWYSGVYPSIAGDTTNGTVCYTWPGNTCIYSNSIEVTNCNGYYVFALTASFRCSIRYCTI